MSFWEEYHEHGEKLSLILERLECIMAAIDDLNTAVAALTAADVTNTADILAAIAALAAAAPPNLQPAIAAINAAVADENTQDTALNAALNPTPPPAPATSLSNPTH